MFVRALIMGLAVFAVASSAMAQTSPSAYYAEQKIKLDLLQKQGRITPAQRQAMELKLLQQLGRSGSNGPKTGVYPQPIQGGSLQGSANAAAAQQAAARAQAEKSREALKRKNEAKKSKKKGDKDEGDDANKDAGDKDGAKKEKKK